MIHLNNVSKVYEGGFEALKDINLEFKEAKINVLIGPSGCGKTTTMKLLNKLIEHTDGTIYFDDRNIKDINTIELRREMGYVIQNIGLFPHMSIYNNVAAVPKLLKWNKESIDQRVDELLTMVNLEPNVYRKRYPSELSGGQQQRIGVIRALAANPDIILMDEPFSALDPISREQLQDELVNLQKDIKKTIVFVTHDMDEAIKIADQIILMQDGKIVQQGSPEELLTTPKNDFVKEFIGSKRLKQNELELSLTDVMNSNITTVTPETSLEKTVSMMTEQQTPHLPVVSKEDVFVGMVSIYDAIPLIGNQYVKDVLFQPDILISEKTDVTDALNQLVKSKVSLVPVISETGIFLGVINNEHMDLLEEFMKDKDGSH